MRATPERFRGVFVIRRYTNPHLLYLTSLSTLMVVCHQSLAAAGRCWQGMTQQLHAYLIAVQMCVYHVVN